MNMKKTIAAIAAGAVAVSAMATTVSALADTSLVYNLVDTYEVTENTANTFVATFKVTGATNELTKIDIIAPHAWDAETGNQSTTNAAWTPKKITVRVIEEKTGEQGNSYTYTFDQSSLNYKAGVTTAITGTDAAAWDYVTTTTVPFADEMKGLTGDAYTLDVIVEGETTFNKVADANGSLIKGAADKGTATVATLTNLTAGSEKKTAYYLPFKTAIKGNQNITRYLEQEIGYHNVGAVLNDAIENYESVTFTFNTATAGIIWTPDFKNFYGTNQWGGQGLYETGLASVGGYADKLTAVYSSEWWADTSYMSFDQHLYQGTVKPYGTYITSYASEGTGYTGFDWTGYNLFQGALVINENLTMSLAETDYFDWTATSLSFDWDAIMDGAMTSNDYAVYLHSMKLATSNTWYWDNMTVVLTAGAEEDATSDAGVEADDEELAEEEVEEEVVEEEVEEEVEVEVSNPTTGNASVALAVIPVALAAAAVVAKKRS